MPNKKERAIYFLASEVEQIASEEKLTIESGITPALLEVHRERLIAITEKLASEMTFGPYSDSSTVKGFRLFTIKDFYSSISSLIRDVLSEVLRRERDWHKPLNWPEVNATIWRLMKETR